MTLRLLAALSALLAALLAAVLAPALALLLALAPDARAEERVAFEETLAGDKALAAKDAAVAEKHFRAAIESDAEHLPAYQGLGEALLLLGRTPEARVALRRVDRSAGRLDTLSADLRPRVEAARRRLAEVDPQGMALADLFRAHADAVTQLGERQRDADPGLADRAAGIALALVPDHARALELRARLAERGLRREALFDGRQIADWDGGRSDMWRVTDGVIVAEAKGVATFVRTVKVAEGDFDVLMEARLVATYEGTPFFALMGAWTEEYCHSRFGVLADTLQWIEYRSRDDSERVYRELLAKLPKALDPRAWNVYELRYQGERIEALVNGRKLAELKRPDARKGGFVGLLAQDCRIEVKRVEVVYR